MKKATEIFRQKDTTTSFEFFPPKTEKGYSNLLNTIAHLSAFKPDFISCTYGAGGGNRDKTFDIVQHIQEQHGIIGMAHLTCVLNTKDQIKEILENVKKRDICNVLALRGDPPLDNPNWQPGENNFRYSYELCRFIRDHFGDHFGIGVAGFPEGHTECPSKELDAQYLKMKIDNGADFVITQLFFDNKDYFDYIKRLKAVGVNARVIPGILPITNYSKLLSFCERSGATVPQKVKDIFAPLQGQDEKTLATGIQFAVEQCRELLAGGAPGLHFYTLNKVHPVDEILKQVRSKT